MKFLRTSSGEVSKYKSVLSNSILTYITLSFGLIISVTFITIAFTTQSSIHNEKLVFRKQCLDYLVMSNQLTEHSRRIGVLNDITSLDEYQELHLRGGRQELLNSIEPSLEEQQQQVILNDLKILAESLTEKEHLIIYLSSKLREHENIISFKALNHGDDRLQASKETFYPTSVAVDVDNIDLESYTVELLYSSAYEKTREDEYQLINQLYSSYIQSRSRELKYAERQGIISILLLTVITFLIPIFGISDLKKRDKIQEDLYKKKEHLDVILRSVTEGVISTDLYGRVITLNKTGEEILGIESQNVFGRRIWEVLSIFQPRCKRPINLFTIHKDKGILSLNKQRHFKLKTISGEQKSIVLKCAKLLDKNGKSHGYVIAFADITERIELEKEIMKNKKLESLGVLAGGIAHDFNNILTVIKGNLCLSMQGKTKDDYIIETEKALDTAQGLTYQLLTFSKGGSPVKETATLKELIVETASFILRGSSIKCVYQIEEDLHPVEIDRGQINAVLNNLLLNAMHSMPNGGTIKITGKNTEVYNDNYIPLIAGSYTKITVADQGIGISKENLEKVFDPYFTTKEKGSGLGLSSAFSIVKNHGGHMIVESTEGKGTNVSFYLPATNKEAEKLKQNIILEDGEIYKKSGKILVMDDEKGIRHILETVLTNIGFDVDLVTTGEQAIEEVSCVAKNQKYYDLIIMDLTIQGGMGGKEAIEKIRKIDPNIKAIVTSGYSNDPVMAYYKDYGFDGYVKKPYNGDDILTTVSKVLS
ncbi:ATP-binding protein [Proteinivorax tanatarense]|uniref:Stage 0 sporulation protein A homolog n=1 Tax=Proteinivorax tanatarense TaxID=1260629 RepID=A0AAU7VIE5_9FIRM